MWKMVWQDHFVVDFKKFKPPHYVFNKTITKFAIRNNARVNG